MLDVLIIVLLTLALYNLVRRRDYFAKWDHLPGYKSWNSLPWLGHGYMLKSTPLEKLEDCRAKFGDFFRLDSGPVPTVWLCDYDDITATLKLDVVAGRPHKLMPGVVSTKGVDTTGEPYGIAFSNGATWTEQRRFLSQHLASTKHTFDAMISEECARFVDDISSRVSSENRPVTVNNLYLEPVNRILWRMMTGKAIESGPQLSELTDSVRNLFRVVERTKMLYLIQFTTSWGPYAAKALGLSNIPDMAEPIRRYLKMEVDGASPDDQGNFIDRFLHERANTNRANSSFYGQTGINNLLTTLEDVFLAGSDTVSAFLEWFTLYMMRYPEVQERCQREIDAVIGDRPAVVGDRNDTHYVEATILEVMRHSPHMTLTLQHYTTEDIHIRHYPIPKGTQLYYYSGAVHYNPEFFAEPETFRPVRFLSPDGKFQPDERVIYFGIGKRRCVGEILGRAESYLLAVALLQRFQLSAVDGGEKDLDLKSYIPGLNMHVLPLAAKFKQRY